MVNGSNDAACCHSLGLWVRNSEHQFPCFIPIRLILLHFLPLSLLWGSHDFSLLLAGRPSALRAWFQQCWDSASSSLWEFWIGTTALARSLPGTHWRGSRFSLEWPETCPAWVLSSGCLTLLLRLWLLTLWAGQLLLVSSKAHTSSLTICLPAKLDMWVPSTPLSLPCTSPLECPPFWQLLHLLLTQIFLEGSHITAVVKPLYTSDVSLSCFS